MLWLTYPPPNLKSLPSAVKEIWNSLKVHKMGVVNGHPRSSAMSSFDRAHTISYSSFNRNYASILYRFRDVRRVICRHSTTSTYHTYIWRPSWGWPRSNFGIRKVESLGYLAALFASYPTFGRFSRTPTCDRQTDRHRAMVYIARADFGQISVLSWERYKIETYFQWKTNTKSYVAYRMAAVLNDLEGHSRLHAFSRAIRRTFVQYFTRFQPLFIAWRSKNGTT